MRAYWRWAFLATSIACAAMVAASTSRVAYPAFYPADAARGSTLAGACLSCHGTVPMTFGTVPYHAPRLGGQRASSIFDALLQYKDRQRDDPIMRPIAAALSEQEMRDISAYLAGAEIKPSFDAVPDSWARAKVMEDCAACHGETGLGVMHGIPVIGGQYQDYLVHALQSYKNGARKDPTMAVMARRLLDAQITELGQYFEYFRDRNYMRDAR